MPGPLSPSAKLTNRSTRKPIREFSIPKSPSRSYQFPMISINQRASEALRDLLAEKQAGPTVGLRLAVKRGGCAGWQYEMKVTEPEADDHIIEFDGGRLIVDAESTERLKDCVVDYEDSLSDAGFRIRNPQAARSCGCGTSFEAVGETPPEPEEIEDCGKP